MVILLDLLAALLGLFELLIKSLLLLTAVLLELDLCLGETGLFFDQSRDDDNLVLLDLARLNVLIKRFLFSLDLVKLLLVLTFLVLKLLDLFF